MTEEQIEVWVERATDALDARFVPGGTLTQEEYDAELRRIDAKAEAMRRANMWERSHAAD